ESEGVDREFGVAGLEQEGVEAAAMLDRAQGGGGDAQAHRTLQRVRDQRDIDEVRQEPRTGLVIGMADEIAGLHGLAGQFATAGHWVSFRFLITPAMEARAGSRRKIKALRPKFVKPPIR